MPPPDRRVFRKTDRGAAALGARSQALTARERTALILINGRDTAAAVGELLGADGPALIAALVARGFAAEVEAAPRVAPAPPVPGTVAIEAELGRLPSLKERALQILAPQFGPDVDVVCRPLLAAQTLRDFRAALDAVEAKLSIYLGVKGARRLLDEVRG